MTIAQRVAEIRENMEAACARAGRSAQDVTLIAVTKFVEEEKIAAALACGIGDAGENRVQEWQRKQNFFQNAGVRTHLIGQLQANKVKYVIGQNISLLQSVDRLSLASEIERQCQVRNCTQDVLIEINIGGEEQKGGVPAAELPELLAKISALSHVHVQGLMCVPPAVGAEDARRYFARMRTLFETTPSMAGVSMRHLSMGMSGDYTVAIEEGATMVRIGTAIFGARAPRPGGTA